MWLNITILSLVTLQRLVELYIARRNTRKLLERGGFELGSNHYPFIVALHALWLAGLWYLVIYQSPALSLPWIFAYLVLEAARGWVIAALGSRWTTRIIVVPGETLIDEGPYKYIRHPNYMVVAGEIFILPMAFGFWWYAIIFGVLNIAVLWWRIRTEDAALKELREPPAEALPQPPDSSPEP
jgi:methyltransferase